MHGAMKLLSLEEAWQGSDSCPVWTVQDIYVHKAALRSLSEGEMLRTVLPCKSRPWNQEERAT